MTKKPTKPRDPRVSAAYKEVADERTPEHLDHVILNAARAAARPRWNRAIAWLRPAAWVATIGVCLAIVIEISLLPEQEQVEFDSPPQAAAPAEPAAVMPASDEEIARDEAFIDHMHAHAEQLDNLNFALADDDLAGAMTAAYWLSGHQEVTGIKGEWRPYLEGMREAAQAVEEATDIDTARAAAERINDNCQGCHKVAGVDS